MYSQFSASHFRRFEEVELRGLSRFNLITGPNGIGKTSLLEALFVFSGAFSPELALRLDMFRGQQALRVELGPDTATTMRSLFHDLDSGRKAVLSGLDDDTKVVVEITVPKSPSRPSKAGALTTTATDTQVVSSAKALRLRTTVGTQKAVESTLEISEKGVVFDKVPSVRKGAVFLQMRTEINSGDLTTRLGKVVVAKEQDLVVDALRVVEPRIVSLTTVAEGNQPTVYADIGLDELVPLWLLGGGLNHLAHIVLAIREARGRVILIDELENGLYYDVLPDVWKVIRRAALEADCQVFATTHSRECVAAAYQAFSETLDYDLSMHRLESSNGNVEAISYDKETLEASIEAGFEVR